MDGGREEICKELDATVLDVMASLKRLAKARERYRSAVKEGYFSMVQARHAMGGPNRVSSLQYDTSMSALVNVQMETTPGSENGASFPGKDPEEKTDFRLEWKFPDRKEKKSSTVSGGDEVSMRKRHVTGGVEDVSLEMEVARDYDDEGGVKRGEAVKDPLLWFGVLVPPTLRQSQQHFKQGIECSVEMAAAQVQLVTAQKKYEKLLRQKNQI